MDVRTGPRQRDTGAGFTLVELLLAVGLVVLLLGALVFNFSVLQRGVSLDEGANQIEALIRFARAHAASSGRQVQITFEEDVGDGFFIPLGNLRVFWEPDPVARPGFFEPLRVAEEYVRSLTDLISIEGVRLVEGDSFEPVPADTPLALDKSADSDFNLVTFPPIGFFPDGSSDSAEIILASRSDDDKRRLAVRLQGITGSIHRQLITDELKAVEPESSPETTDAVTTLDPAPPRPRPRSHSRPRTNRAWLSSTRTRRRTRTNGMACGAVLLEVVLALVLFAAAAAIIGAGMHSAISSVERQKLNLHAVNLAASVLSEIQMGFRSVESVGPESFDSPFDHWTWQLILAPTETEAGEPSDLTRVEVIVRHDDPALVHRLTQVLKLEKKTQPAVTAAASLSP